MSHRKWNMGGGEGERERERDVDKQSDITSGNL